VAPGDVEGLPILPPAILCSHCYVAFPRFEVAEEDKDEGGLRYAARLCSGRDLVEEFCWRFETGGSLSRRVSVLRAPAQMGRARGRARRGERSEEAGVRRERGGNPAAFVFVPRPGRVRLQ
jgi:hypothetical protein